METFPSHLMRERKSRNVVKEETKLWKVKRYIFNDVFTWCFGSILQLRATYHCPIVQCTMCMWARRGGTIGQYWATNIMHLWWVWVGSKVHCTVCTLSWGWHGPEPARWGANNGMHTAHCTLYTALWCSQHTHTEHCTLKTVYTTTSHSYSCW